MKEPIDPSEIREGDRVMAVSHGMETTFTVDHVDQGRLYAQPGNADHISTAFLRDRDNEWFLLERPKPAVVLPTEPTLGWVTSTIGAQDLDFWRYRPAHDETGEGAWAGSDPDGKPRGWGMRLIAAFTPATAVPAEALEKLRVAEGAAMDVQPYHAERKNEIRCHAINLFLDAVDAANAATS